MSASVISDRRLRRKRGSAWGWFGRRFGALAVTLAALGTVSWLSPILGGAPLRKHPPAPPVAQFAPPRLTAIAAKAADTGADATAPQAQPPRHRRHSVSLNAAHSAHGDGFEVLNAAELEAISQAR